MPYRIEKLMGNIIDEVGQLDTKRIIILKCASVIGNIFDLNTLCIINPLKSLMNDDIYDMIKSMEIVNSLFDLNF